MLRSCPTYLTCLTYLTYLTHLSYPAWLQLFGVQACSYASIVLFSSQTSDQYEVVLQGPNYISNYPVIYQLYIR